MTTQPITLARRRREGARRLLVVPNADDPAHRSVWVLRRFDSSALIGAGVAEILGADAGAVAQVRQQRERDREQIIASAPDDETRAARLAELDRAIAAEDQAAWDAMQTDPKRQTAWLKRCDAYAMGAVEACGIAREDAPDGIQPPGKEPAAVCIPLNEDPDAPVYTEPVRLVREAAAPGKPDELPIYELPIPERIAIGWSAMIALEVASQLQPFRGGPGVARAR